METTSLGVTNQFVFYWSIVHCSCQFLGLLAETWLADNCPNNKIPWIFIPTNLLRVVLLVQYVDYAWTYLHLGGGELNHNCISSKSFGFAFVTPRTTCVPSPNMMLVWSTTRGNYFITICYWSNICKYIIIQQQTNLCWFIISIFSLHMNNSQYNKTK